MFTELIKKVINFRTGKSENKVKRYPVDKPKGNHTKYIEL